MIFRQILFEIFTILNNERTISSAYHLLRGKRSGQTIQDVGMYKLHRYFALLPKLQRETFNEEVVNMERDGLLQIDEDGLYSIASKMEEASVLYFDGWRYRGNEHRFFSRLALVIETISHSKHGNKYFAPTEKKQETIQFVRHFLRDHPFQEKSFHHQLYDELEVCLSAARFSTMQRELIVHRLTGVDVAGTTWGQLAQRFDQSQMDIYLSYISGLHILLNEIFEREVPILAALAEGVEVSVPLTDTTKITANYLAKGYSIDQIAQVRRLKTSTIEDHIVEMAINIPTFSLAPFMREEDIATILQASEAYDTKKLRVLKEVLPEFSYFQLRLALAKGAL